MRRIIFIFGLVFLLVGCATIFSEDSDEITVISDPQGAQVFLDQEKIGTTPVSFSIKRDTFNDKYITVKKEGFSTHRFNVRKSIDEVAYWNFGFLILTFGAPSWGIDAVSGSLLKYAPNSYFVDLRQQEDQSLQGKKVSFAAKAFIARNFEKIKNELSRGGGNHLMALAEMLSRESPTGMQAIMVGSAAELIATENAIDFSRVLRNLIPAR